MTDYIVTVAAVHPVAGESPGELEISARNAKEAESLARAHMRREGLVDRHTGPMRYSVRRA